MKALIMVFVCIMIMVSCMPVRVVTDTPTDESLSDFDTYSLYSIDFLHYDSLPYNEENFNLLVNEIKKNMEKKGFSYTDKDPDILLNIGVVVEKESLKRETDPRYDMNYIGQRTYHWEREEVVVGFYEEGAVTIDFVNPETNMLIWQGTAIGMMSEKPKKMQKRIIYAIEQIFEKMPVSDPG